MAAMENPQVNIRKATPDDAQAIASVHFSGWRTTYEGLLPEAFLADLSYEQHVRDWSQRLAAPEGRRVVRIAEDQRSKILGFASGGPERGAASASGGEIYAIQVVEDHRGEGIGKGLFIAVAGGLVLSDMRSLLVWVVAANPARGFYDRLGGRCLRTKIESIGGASVPLLGYEWQDLRALVAPAR